MFYVFIGFLVIDAKREWPLRNNFPAHCCSSLLRTDSICRVNTFMFCKHVLWLIFFSAYREILWDSKLARIKLPSNCFIPLFQCTFCTFCRSKLILFCELLTHCMHRVNKDKITLVNLVIK